LAWQHSIASKHRFQTPHAAVSPTHRASWIAMARRVIRWYNRHWCINIHHRFVLETSYLRLVLRLIHNNHMRPRYALNQPTNKTKSNRVTCRSAIEFVTHVPDCRSCLDLHRHLWQARGACAREQDALCGRRPMCGSGTQHLSTLQSIQSRSMCDCVCTSKRSIEQVRDGERETCILLLSTM
jgi:hypothetical protein